MSRFQGFAHALNVSAVFILSLVTVITLGSLPSAAAELTLYWDANTETDLAGYRIHYGEASGAYTVHRDVGKVTTCVVTGLVEGRTYYLTATAYDYSGNESAYCPELVHAVPGVPEMDVLGNGVVILDGDSSPALADHTDFGSAALTGQTVTRTFTVRNAGTGPLALTGSPRAVLSGANAADFTVTVQPASPVAAGGSTTFQVRFDPSQEGLRSAALSISSDDGDENPYNFSIQGTGTVPPAPEINIVGNGQNIADGDSSPSPADGTDFGTVSVLDQTVTRTFTIQNLGNADLNLTGSPRVVLGGANAADFSVTLQPSSPVAAGGSTTFQVRFDPAGEGLRSATVSMANDDSSENPYNFAIQGTGSMPAETVSAPSAPAGATAGYTGLAYSYSTGGSSTNYGDGVQYLIEWGDGTDSGWLSAGAASAAKTWASAGAYSVRAKARCAAHTGVESAWSGVLVVNITRDTIAPAPPMGFRMGAN